MSDKKVLKPSAEHPITVEPNPANREVYDRLYEVYQQLYPATKEQVHMLAALQLEEGVTPEGSRPEGP